MLAATAQIDRIEQIELRQEANYWHAQHQRAVERAVYWKQKALELAKGVGRQEAQLAELTGQIEALKAKVAWFQRHGGF